MRRTTRPLHRRALARARAAAPVGTIAVLGAGVLGAALATAGCRVDTCTPADLDCFLQHLTIFTPASGSSVDLTFVPAASVQPASATAGAGGAPGLPKITNRPPALSISDPETLTDTELDWSDPDGCQPAFCFRTCTPGPTSAADCSSQFACTAAQTGGTTGQWTQAIGFIAGSSGAPVFFTLGVTPVSSAQCGQVVDQIKSGSGAVAGAEVAIATAIAGASGASGQICSAPTVCSQCSMSACTDGTSCSYLASDGTSFPCSDCQSCESAGAQILAHCCPDQAGTTSSTSSTSSSTSTGSTGSSGPP